jgi:endonuclease/exonuclease/phosphatase family metal-dependent hydrolase
MRICTFNVHLWTDKGDRSNTAAVIRLLRGLDCDVVALNEVLAEGAQLAEVARELGMHHALGKASWLGNALLSKRPLHDVETVAITRGYEEARSALIATVEDAAGQRFDVCSTHLAPQHESTRLGQLANLRRALERRAPAHLVMGDFNALRLSDYAPAALDALRATRAAREREEPRGEVVEVAPAVHRLDAFRDGELATCWAGTRIDYVWMSPALLDARRVRGATHVENDASDHLPVVVDLA